MDTVELSRDAVPPMFAFTDEHQALREVVRALFCDTDDPVTGWRRLLGEIGAGRVEVNPLHHQTVATLGTDVREVAHGDDGVVEAVEVDQCAFALAVQWHPELLRHRDEHLALFEALVSAARGTR